MGASTCSMESKPVECISLVTNQGFASVVVMDVTRSTGDATNVSETFVFVRSTATAAEILWYGVRHCITLVSGSWVS